MFAGRRRLLASHRGWDPGSLELGEALAQSFGVRLFAGSATRLLVDLNRSLHHPHVFSEVTRRLGPDERQAVVDAYWRPFRERVEAAIRGAAGPVLHLSTHSFTPVLDGQRREADIGILYDPSRAAERCFARDLQGELATLAPQLRVRRNFPYRGVADGHVTALRRLFENRRYAGIELELSQRHVGSAQALRRLIQPVLKAVGNILDAD